MIWIDDGYEQTFKYALPILNKYKIKAVWSIPVGLLGKELEGGRIINEKQLKKLAKTQIIANHTLKHRYLNKLDYNKAKGEIIDSKIKLKKITGKSIIYFSYPYDSIPNKKIIDLVKKQHIFIRPFYTYAFHLISPKTYKYYPYCVTPKQFEEYLKWIKK